MSSIFTLNVLLHQIALALAISAPVAFGWVTLENAHWLLAAGILPLAARKWPLRLLQAAVVGATLFYSWPTPGNYAMYIFGGALVAGMALGALANKMHGETAENASGARVENVCVSCGKLFKPRVETHRQCYSCYCASRS